MEECSYPVPCFMAPHPDENCYSVLCRSMVRAAYSSFRFTYELFGGQRNLTRLLYQPFRVEDLSRWFNDAANRQKDYLDLHSVFQYCYPSLEEHEQKLIINWRNNLRLSSEELKRLTKTVAFKDGQKRKLCYCRDCVQNDRETYGETYWHLSHQLPAVTLCSLHETPLICSEIEICKTRYVFYPAEYVLRKSERNENLESISTYDSLVASDSMWMLHHGFEVDGEKNSKLKSSVGDEELAKISNEIQCYKNELSVPESSTLELILFCRILSISPQSLTETRQNPIIDK